MQLARTSDEIQSSVYNRDSQKGSQEKIRDKDLSVFLFPSEILFLSLALSYFFYKIVLKKNSEMRNPV